ncbi:MAG TPA: glutamyl-tRNA reductase [Solirubrobacteraceae bacterium]|nr:glutamyl-tRNA reductase [Solirubrobacteraceae bacterium]
MSDELIALGVSHKTAPIELRERLALTEGRASEFGAELLAEEGIDEAVAISTCNRTELYLVGPDGVQAESVGLAALARLAGIRPTELASEAVYALRNCDAAAHLYRVTAGLESMIVGEAEVQGQVKRAYESAREAGSTGPLTNKLFAAALATGKRVRSETGISASRLSVSSVAVALAREALGDLHDLGVVVLGTGETAELTAHALAEEGARTTFIANRRRDRARALAERFGGRSVGFEELPRELGRADIVVSGTSSPHAIVGAEEVEVVMRGRPDRPLLFVDIAVPRDIDPACAEIAGVTLHDIDDLQAVVARNRSVRQAEARPAERIIDEELERFARWLGSLEVLPTIGALRGRGEDIVTQVLGENAGRWEKASPRDLARVEAVARAVVNRLLHEPTLRLKRAGSDHVHARLEVLRELFALDEARPAHDADRPAAEVRELRRRDGR